MNAASAHPLAQAFKNNPQETPKKPCVKILNTSGIKIPMSLEEKVVDVESEAACEASGISGSFVDSDIFAFGEKAGPGLEPKEWHGEKESSVRVMKEKPLHRVVAYMAASGATTQRIADETGFSVNYVRILMNQKWMKAHVAQLIHENFNDDVVGILKAGAIEAIMTIRNLSQDSPNEKVRLEASKDILDRYRGKATQFIHTSSNEIAQDPSEEILRLTDELKEIEQIQALK